MASEHTNLQRRLRAQGFQIEVVKNGHLRVTNPEDGRSVQIACTPKMHGHVMKNTIARLRRTLGYQHR